MVAPAALALIYPALLTSLMRANYTVFPNEEGVPYLIKIDNTPLTLEERSALAANVNEITFTLFTRNNRQNGHVLKLNDINSVRGSQWGANKPTILVAHGWKSSGTSSACTLIRDAFLKALDCNVVVIDWSSIAHNIAYSVVAKSVPDVAAHVASFVNFLRSKAGLNPSNTKLIGHSLGAHVASLSARLVSNVAEVIALDPAKPMFQNKESNNRVDSSHAKNVQVIHTCAGLLGMDTSVGTSDFFANGGRNQPGCNNDLLGACAHGRSYEYYSESITNPRGFLGTPKNGGLKVYMGGPTLSSSARGTYDFKTRSQPPYAVGG
ncbi:PREDICTED: pancreatic lipase-related protein 2-like [Habropoda laboriosa]|uniref:pancreatic lipase-related protein 2-like n=1 Tax=Habropoda laboriosa TaxID=597456 RepID=UPI00083CE5A1|nr:PREDICTED: pancreatic lipase-related protein 2-like [Habropoda laboriosa]